MQDKRVLYIIIIAFGLILIYTLISVIPSYKRGDFTTYGIGRNGYKAFFLLLKKMGYKCKRVDGDPKKLSQEGLSTLILINPFPRFIKKEKAKKLLKWVKKGNHLIVAGYTPTPFLKMFKITYKPVLSELSTKDKIKIYLKGKAMWISPKSPWRISIEDKSKIRWHIIAKDNKGIISMSCYWGRGKITFISTPELFNNNNIDTEDNVLFITNILKGYGDGIAFDESIHGYFIAKGTYKLSPLAKAVLWQMAISLIIFYIYSFKRFGFIRKIEEDKNRSVLEYIHSFALLFKKAKSEKFIAENIIRRVKRCIGKPSLHKEDIDTILKYIPSKYKDRVKEILQKCLALVLEKSKIEENEILQMAQEMEKIIRQIKT